MTPEELDAIEKRYTLTDDAVDWHGESAVWETVTQVPDLIDTLREAWAEVDVAHQDGHRAYAAMEKRYEREHAWATDYRAQRDNAQAALDRANRLLRYVLHLRMCGENAPGGNETWQQADRDIERHLRAIEGEK